MAETEVTPNGQVSAPPDDLADRSAKTTTVFRARRTNAEKAHLEGALIRLAEDNAPVTVRQLFYLLVSAKLVPKDENGYALVSSYGTDLRESGRLGFECIVDYGRAIREPSTWTSPASIVGACARDYKTPLWDQSDIRPFVITEKATLVPVIGDECRARQVPLAALGGYGSTTFVNDLAERIDREYSLIHVFYIGDRDPSGLDLERDCRDRLERYGADIGEWTRLAVTDAQVDELALPVRPVKMSDGRTRKYIAAHGNDCVDVEAIPPGTLRQLVRDATSQYLDVETIERQRSETAQGRALIRMALAMLDPGTLPSLMNNGIDLDWWPR